MTGNAHLPQCLLLLLLILPACSGSSGATLPEEGAATPNSAPAAAETPVVEPYLEIQPRETLADEVVAIEVGGLPAGQPVTLKAWLQDDLEQRWESQATFQAREDGRLDVAAQVPISGTYTIADPMGLFWSMLPDVPGNRQPFFADFFATTLPVTITAEIEGEPIAAATANRIRVKEGVRAAVVAGDGVEGVFFVPAGEGPFPAVITLGGSGGMPDNRKAAMLASHGYAALALDYFGGPRLPEELSGIPLEYFETAIEWLKSQDAVDAERIGVVGTSRGGELALLLGATFTDVKAVVSYVGSGLVYGDYTPRSAGREPAWTYRGEPIPFFRLGQPATMTAAVIPVERINGPVLLISGEDDQLWSSAELSEIAMVRLAEQEHPYHFEHLRYEDAGHLIGLPHWPATVSQGNHPVTGALMVFGGTAEGNAQASADSWGRVLEFLEVHLKGAGAHKKTAATHDRRRPFLDTT